MIAKLGNWGLSDASFCPVAEHLDVLLYLPCETAGAQKKVSAIPRVAPRIGVTAGEGAVCPEEKRRTSLALQSPRPPIEVPNARP